MEKDTVLLAVEKYNELRDFQKEVKSGKVFSFSRTWYSGGETKFFFTENEVVKEFEAKIKELAAKNKELEAKNKELEAKNKELEAKIEKYGVKEPKEISINDLKKMSYWEFRKWRKS